MPTLKTTGDYDKQVTAHQWTQADMVGGHPALDFLNTVSDTGKSRHDTRLKTWADYLGWMAAAEIDFAPPRVRKSSQPATLAKIHALREVSYSILHAVAAGKTPNGGALARLQTYIQDAYRCADLTLTGGELGWKVSKQGGEPHLHGLVLLLDDFLRTADLRRLRECGRCTWLFLDTGRGRGRKWCDMRTCGNRAKSESFRAKSATRQ